MEKLPLSILPIPGEHATSAASRLAAANLVPLREFLRDMGISPRALVRGEGQALTALACLSGISAEALRADTPMCLEGAFYFRGRRVSSVGGQGGDVIGCAECLLEAPGLKGIWSLPYVSICLAHRRPLVSLWSTKDPLDGYDIAKRLPQTDLAALGDMPERDPTAFEFWYLERLQGQDAAAHWLDQFEPAAAAEFCARLGRAAIATRLPKWRKLDADKNWWPFDVGFNLCCGGEEHLSQTLKELQPGMGSPDQGPRKIFGGFYDWLTEPVDDGVKPFQDILRAHMHATWAMGPGDEVLGEPVLIRQRMWIKAAATLLNRSRSEITSALDAGQVAIHEAGAEEWCHFDWHTSRPVLELLNPGLDVREFCDSLQITPTYLTQLEDEGLLLPRGPALWDPLAAQDLVDELLLGAEPIYVAMHDWCGLEDAARRMGQRLPQVIADIRSGRLRVGKYMQRSGFASVLVNLGHVTQVDGSISVAAFAAWIGLSNSELMAFLRRNDMLFHKVAGPRGGAQLRMTPADQQAFRSRFLSFRSLGVKARLTWADLRRHLAEEGITPVGGSERIYHCRAVAHLFT